MWDASPGELIDVRRGANLVGGTFQLGQLRHDAGQCLAHALVDQRFARRGGETEGYWRCVGPAELELVRSAAANGQ